MAASEAAGSAALGLWMRGPMIERENTGLQGSSLAISTLLASKSTVHLYVTCGLALHCLVHRRAT